MLLLGMLTLKVHEEQLQGIRLSTGRLLQRGIRIQSFLDCSCSLIMKNDLLKVIGVYVNPSYLACKLRTKERT